jgi:hypothetical protein
MVEQTSAARPTPLHIGQGRVRDFAMHQLILRRVWSGVNRCTFRVSAQRSQQERKRVDTNLSLGLLAQVGTPQPIIVTLADAAHKAMHTADAMDSLHKQGYELLTVNLVR